MIVPLEYYLLVSAALFCVGLFGVLTRRNALLFLISVEFMLNAANLNIAAVALQYGDVSGQLFVLFTIGLAAAEVAVGIGIILVLYRNFDTINVTLPRDVRW